MKLKPLWLALGQVSQRLERTRRILVASDYDGTLTPIVGHPTDAGLPPRTRRALARLARLEGMRVAVLSGRMLHDLRRRIGLRGVLLSGTVGHESLEPGGRVERHVPPGREIPDELRGILRAWCERFEGAWIEDKRLMLAVHYRQVPTAAQRRFATGVRARLAPFRRRVRLVAGKKVIEVMPAGIWNKASVLARWWNGSRSDLLVYFGDDEHDEPVYAFVRKHGGIAVAVGRRRSKAEYALANDEEVTWWLEWLEREWRENYQPSSSL